MKNDNRDLPAPWQAWTILVLSCLLWVAIVLLAVGIKEAAVIFNAQLSAED